jgi:ribosome-binding factor A
MASGKRNEKLGRQIQKDLSQLFLKNQHDWFESEFVTISAISVTPDLSIAKVYVSLYNTKNKTAILNALEEKNHIIRRELARLIKNSVKKIPELRFIEDTSLDMLNKLDELLAKVKKEDE